MGQFISKKWCPLYCTENAISGNKFRHMSSLAQRWLPYSLVTMVFCMYCKTSGTAESLFSVKQKRCWGAYNFFDSSQLALLFGNFPVGLVLLWGLKRGDFLAQKGAPKIGQKVAPQSPKPNGKLLIWTNIVMTYSWNTEMFKLQRSFSAMGTTSGILRIFRQHVWQHGVSNLVSWTLA